MDDMKKKLLLIFGPTIASTFLLLFVVFIAVFFVLGIFGDGDSDSGSNSPSGPGSSSDIVYYDKGGDALYDGSYTKETFVSLVKNYTVPNGKSSVTGRTYVWGYETFFVANVENFFDISVRYGMDPRFIFCIGIHESGYGTSKIALEKGNFFGWGAYDSSPYESALSFYDMSDGIETVVKGLANNYVKEGGSQYNAIKNRGLDPTTIRGIGSSYASDTNWANAVKNYIQKIFGETYSSSDDGTVILLDDYPLNGSNTTILNGKLSDSQLSTISNNIKATVNNAGYGTGVGVAAAAQSLIMSLYDMGYRLPYYFGGGHSYKITIGADSLWGTSVSADHRGRTKYSYDCSGFVSWAIKNGCKANFQANSSAGFLNGGYGDSIALSSSKPGDLMVKNGHIRLIVKNNGDGSIIAAESTSSYGEGIMFTTYSSAGEYTIVDMSNWYNSNCD